MRADDSRKKRHKISKKKRKEDGETESSQLVQNDVNFYGANEGVKKKTNKKKNKSSVDASEEVIANNTANIKDETQDVGDGSKKHKKLKMKKRKNARTGIEEVIGPHTNEDEDGVSGNTDFASETAEKKLRKSRKKKRKNVDGVNSIAEVNQKDDVSGRWDANLLEKGGEGSEDDVYQMSSGDEDYSKGMKKWIGQYHQSRPGLKVLQERIDDFIMNHEAEEEKARAERESQAAEGGWTVVVHHKGRKKTTDAETGLAVGSVAQAAVLDKMAKKKKKDVGLDFYRFQKREAQMNEIMMLQSKFEQDKKRIQQMRAARKFRPY